MENFAEYLDKIDDPLQKERTETVLNWVHETFPGLGRKVAWNQPMFTDHETFIIAFSTAKAHMSVAPETAAIERFAARIVQAGYSHTNQLFRIPWKASVDYELLRDIVAFNIEDKTDCQTFWRK
ncbi:iron chaperone [Saccharibacillus alkalitolerans]|uniref:Iron chaperone n=1 Tax=Saccharibacillus alkalitolerans TaxID=2705290 RepID=A0ABX0F206_9BACL|nr:iron chaperone [Saccharibacillus alkalitolerans]NGZ74525.1 iron chaperone [Saccharibacillus alkalitolerans]